MTQRPTVCPRPTPGGGARLELPRPRRQAAHQGVRDDLPGLVVNAPAYAVHAEFFSSSEGSRLADAVAWVGVAAFVLYNTKRLFLNSELNSKTNPSFTLS